MISTDNIVLISFSHGNLAVLMLLSPVSMKSWKPRYCYAKYVRLSVQSKSTIHNQPKTATQQSVLSTTLRDTYTNKQTNKSQTHTQTNTDVLRLVYVRVLCPNCELVPLPSGFVCISKFETKYFDTHTFLKLHIIKKLTLPAVADP